MYNDRRNVRILFNVLVGCLLCLLIVTLFACTKNEDCGTPSTVPTDTDEFVVQTPAVSTEALPQQSTATAAQNTTFAPPVTEVPIPDVTPPVTDAPIPDVTPLVTDAPIPDVTPPVVTGENFEITQGDSVSYRNKITVVDDYDDSPTITIDNSAVDLDTPGIYPVIYTVTDQSGNSTVVTLQLTVQEKKYSESETEEYVLHQAESILDSITDDSMSKLQVAYAIYNWTSKNISYIGTSDKTSWIIGAYDGFTTRKGDCFTYFATAKALLTVAEIDHADVYRAPNAIRSSRHYWLLVNVGDGWYHFDCNNSTFFASRNANFFMVTDEEIWTWDSTYYRGEHTYDPTGLPEVSTVSIQDKIDYSSETLIG